MHINTVSARTGFHWLKLGFQTFWPQPLAWSLLFIFFIACCVLLQSVPWLGMVVSTASTPLLNLLMAAAAAQVFAGRRLRPAALLAALRDNSDRWPALLTLCALYAIAAFAPLMLATLIDGGDLAGFVLNMDFTEREAAALSQNMWLMLCWYAWLCVLSPAFWFAPLLVHWHGIAPRKALWLSLVACLRNWRAFAVLYLSWIGIMLTLIVGATVVLVIPLMMGVLPPSVVTPLSLVVMTATALVVVIPLLASTVFSLRDCFCGADTSLAAPAGTHLTAA
jgi:hypothetical protein